MDKRNFFILGLFLSLSLLILPNIGFSADFEEINLQEMEKYLTLPERDAKELLSTLNQAFTTERLYGEGSYLSDEEVLALISLQKVVDIDVLNYLLVDTPLDAVWEIVKNAVKVARPIIGEDVSGIIDVVEKETSQKATEYGINFLLQKEIRISLGTISYNYISQAKEEEEITIQYIIDYQPLDLKKARVAINFYSPSPIAPPASQQPAKGIIGTMSNLKSVYNRLYYIPSFPRDIRPFIIEVSGEVEEDKWGNYYWVDRQGRRFKGNEPPLEPVKPRIKIEFPAEGVPDLGIEPVGFWERNFLQPIKTTFEEVETIINRLTGKDITGIATDVGETIGDLWNSLKDALSHLNPFGADIGQILFSVDKSTYQSMPKEEEKEEEDTSSGSKIGTETNPSIPPATETPTQTPALAPAPSPASNQTSALTLEELEKSLDDLAKKIAALNQEMAEFAKQKGAELAQEEEEKEEEEEEEEKEKEKEETSKEICQLDSININTASAEELDKIVGIGPALAQRIIAARPFSSLNDLLKVQGIGEKTLEKILAQGCAYARGYSNIPDTADNSSSGSSGGSSDEDRTIQPQISLSYFPNLSVDGEIDVQLSVSNLENATYDVKISILENSEESEQKRTLSQIYDEKTNKWATTSYNYLKEVFSGALFNKNFKLKIKEDKQNFKGQAEIIAKIRNSQTEKVQAQWQGNINITEPLGEQPLPLNPLNPVENFQIASSTYNIVTLTWTAPSDSNTSSENLFYKVYYSREGELTEDNLSATSTQVATTTQTTITITDLYYNSTYYFGIQAFDGQNHSPLATSTDSYQIPSALINCPWPMYRANPQRNSQSNYSGPNATPTVTKVFNSDDSLYTHPIIRPEGTIFSSVISSGDGQGILALDSNLTKKWFLSTSSITDSLILQPDGTVLPDDEKTRDKEGNIYLAQNSTDASTSTLLVFDKENHEKWKKEFIFNCSTSTSEIVATDETISIFAQNDSCPQSSPYSDFSLSNIVIAPQGNIYLLASGKIYVNGNKNYLYLFVFSSTGNFIASSTISDAYAPAQLAVSSSGAAYFFYFIFGADHAEPYLSAISSTGTLLWEKSIYQLSIYYTSPLSSILIDNQENIYFVIGKDVIALNKNDEEIWRHSLSFENMSDNWDKSEVGIALGSDGTLYLSGQGAIVALEYKI